MMDGNLLLIPFNLSDSSSRNTTQPQLFFPIFLLAILLVHQLD